MSSSIRPPEARHAVVATAACALVLVLFANAVSHLLVACMPLIASDYWNHIDPFLRDAVAGQLDVGNFLVQRAGVDHAQPLNKLVMWANYRWFGLDFQLEGLLGMACGLAALLVLWRLLRAGEAGATPWPAHAALVGIAAVFFSLNSSFIYGYSMVTLWFALYLVGFLVALAAWHALAAGRTWPLAIATLLLGIIGDDSAFLDLAAVSLAVLLWAWRTGQWPAAWRSLAVMLAMLALSRGVYALFGETSGTTQAIFNQPLATRLQALGMATGDAWLWFAIPASSGLLARDALQWLAGDAWTTARHVLAAGLLLAHAWFWWAALRVRPRGAWLAAVVLMLMFYAHVAAVLMARVFVMGSGYLEQERYTSFYQFGIMALLAMGIAVVRERPGGRRGIALAAAALLAVLVQLPTTHLARQREPHVAAYNLQMAADMAAVVRDPRHPPAGCMPAMDLCVLPLEKRVELARLLATHRINLFSPAFQRRHPDMAKAAGLQVPAAP